MKIQLLADLVKKEKLKDDIYKFSVKADEIVEMAKPGQFVEIRVIEGIDPFLRRPISIHNIDKENGILEFIFQVKGKGTSILAKKEIGDKVDIIGPLGLGIFKYENYENIAIIGGGIGIFPLFELAKSAKKDGKNINTYLGFRNKDLVVLEKEFEQVSNNLCLATDDGSYGKNGFAIDFLKEDIKNNSIDCIYACGPLPMLRVVKQVAEENNMPCQISLEERMACGVGVCLGCAVKTSASPKEDPMYVHVCKAGPVFDSKMVEF